jgi:hypothetical protein
MSFFSKLASWLFGGGKTVEKVVDIADKAIDTAQERGERDAQDLESARAMQMFSHGTLFDVFVDGMSRLVRPGVTLWLVGGFIGWWPLPRTETVSEYWQNVFLLVITFWFGGRAILKDLPSAIRSMRGLK